MGGKVKPDSGAPYLLYPHHPQLLSSNRGDDRRSTKKIYFTTCMQMSHFVWALLESFQCSRGNNIILSYMNCRCGFRNFLTDICVFRQFSLPQCDRMKREIYYLCSEWICKLMQKTHLTKFLYHEVLTRRCQNQYTMAGRCVTMPLR